jgi:hypothetical protein
MKSRARKASWACLLTISVILSACGPETPDLSPTQAAQVISHTQEFKHSYTLVKVLSTTRGTGSLNESYTGTFTFRENSSTSIIQAEADFQYFKGRWYMTNFWWGHSADTKMVFTESDIPKDAFEVR